MPDYNNSIIYKLCCKDPEIKEIYVGSTTNLKQRKQGHKKCCNNVNDKAHNYYLYKFIRETGGGFDNWDMVEIEKYNATDKNHLHARERYYLELLGATLNKQVPTRELKEYYQDNKEVINERTKKWREDNKDYDKQYYENNKEKVKQYYKDNKDIINEKNKVKITCESCGSVFSKGDKSKHDKTKKHLNSLNL